MAAPHVEPPTAGLAQRLIALRSNRLLRQNMVLFAGGLGAGVAGFVFHAIASRNLGPERYGEVASLVAIAQVAGNVPAFTIMFIVSRYAATLRTENSSIGIRHMLVRTTKMVIFGCLVAVLASFALAPPAAAFLHMGSSTPLIWLGFGVAAIWLAGIPRGGLQGLQHFPALSVNLALEMVVRSTTLIAFLVIGLAVTGSAMTILIGAAASYLVGMYALRPELATSGNRVRMRSMAMFSLTAAGGTLGIQLLFNGDVVLAKHYLGLHDAGLYGALNKLATIIYFLTLSVSQIMFPRVVEAIAKDTHPGRLLLLSVGIIGLLGLGAIVVFAIAPGLIVNILFGSKYLDATGLLLPVGLIGMLLSLNNLLFNFFLAAHDRSFLPILGLGCVLEAFLIVVNHGSVGSVVLDVMVALVILMATLGLRCILLLPHLHPQAADQPS